MDEAALGALLGRAVTSAVRYETAGISEVDLVTFADGRQAVVKRAPEEWHWTIDKELFVYGFAKKLTEHAELGGDVTLGKRIADHVAERAGLLDTCTTPSLCHNDCHEGNLIARDGHIAALVDFQNAVAGDPLLDLAKCAYYTRRDRGTVVRALAAGYGPPRAPGGGTRSICTSSTTSSSSGAGSRGSGRASRSARSSASCAPL